MTRNWFLQRCNQVWVSASFPDMPGHAFRIGGACQAPTISALLLGATPTKKGTSPTGGGTTPKGGDASPM